MTTEPLRPLPVHTPTGRVTMAPKRQTSVWPLMRMVVGWTRTSWLICLAMLVLGILMDGAIQRYNGLFVDLMTSGPPRWHGQVERMVWILAFMNVGRWVMGLVNGYVAARMGLFVGIHLENFTLLRLMGKDFSFYYHPLTYPMRLPERIRTDAASITAMTHGFVFQCVSLFVNLGMLSFMFSTMVGAPWRMVVAALLPQMLMAPVNWYVSNIEQERTMAINARKASIQGTTNDIMNNLEVIKIWLANNEIIRRRKDEQFELYDMNLMLVQLSNVFGGSLGFLKTHQANMVMVMGVVSVLDRELSWGEFVTIQGLLGILQTQCSTVFSMIRTWRKHKAVADSFARMIHAPVELEAHTDRQPYLTNRPLPRFDALAPVWRALRLFMSGEGALVSSDSDPMLPDKKTRFATALVHASAVSTGGWKRYNLPLAEPVPNLTEVGSTSTATQPRQQHHQHHPPAYRIEWRNVSFRYVEYLADPNKPFVYPRDLTPGPEKPLVHDGLSLTLPAGSITMIVGNNGSGKSTLMRQLVKLVTPQTGDLLVGGVPVDRIDTVELRSHVGLFIQEAPIFNGTVLDNIWLGHDVEHLGVAQKQAITERFIRESGFPLNMDLQRRLSSATVNKSGGEGQKINLLRVLHWELSALVFDEPLNNLDALSVAWFVRRIAQIKRTPPGGYKPTMVVITHQDSPLLTLVDAVWHIADGRAIQEPPTLLATRQRQHVARMAEVAAARQQAAASQPQPQPHPNRVAP